MIEADIWLGLFLNVRGCVEREVKLGFLLLGFWQNCWNAMEIRGKSQSAVPELYKTTPFITLDERRKNLRERREVLELKTIMRSNAVKDLHIAKKAGIAKATDQFTQKNEMARAVSFLIGC